MTGQGSPCEDVRCSIVYNEGKEPKGAYMEKRTIQPLRFLPLAFLSNFLSQRGNIWQHISPSPGHLVPLWLLHQSWSIGYTGSGHIRKCSPALYTWMSVEDPSIRWPEWSVTVSAWMVETQNALLRLHGKFDPTQSEHCGKTEVHGFCYSQPWVEFPAAKLTVCMVLSPRACLSRAFFTLL